MLFWLIYNVGDIPCVVCRRTAVRDDWAHWFSSHGQDVGLRNNRSTLFWYSNFFPARQNFFVNACWNSLNGIDELNVWVVHGPFQLNHLPWYSLVFVSLDASGSHVDTLDNDSVQIAQDLFHNALFASFGMIAPDDLHLIAANYVPLRFLGSFPKLRFWFMKLSGTRSYLRQSVSGGGRHCWCTRNELCVLVDIVPSFAGWSSSLNQRLVIDWFGGLLHCFSYFVKRAKM